VKREEAVTVAQYCCCTLSGCLVGFFYQKGLDEAGYNYYLWIDTAIACSDWPIESLIFRFTHGRNCLHLLYPCWYTSYLLFAFTATALVKLLAGTMMSIFTSGDIGISIYFGRDTICALI